jgi:hypothetical protein
MRRNKKLRYRGISKDGKFLLFETQQPQITEDLDKRTKLWLSSDYLFKESLFKDARETKKIISFLLEWNVNQETYENCEKLLVLLKKCETFISRQDI